LLSRAVAYLPRSHQHRHPFYWPLFFSIVQRANFDGRHDNGDGRYTTATGGTMMRHDSGKGQQGDRMHNDFDERHDDDKGQQGNRRHDKGDERPG
jgi:hypothetical protein